MSFAGPDGQCEWSHHEAGLAHALLCTDRSAREPAQPLTFDGTVRAVVDARLDRRDELAGSLAAAGRHVRGDASDEELVLHAWHAWQTRCVEHLHGDFALIIWDAMHRRMFAARDRLGIRPLYWARLPGCVLVGNVQQSLAAHPDVASEINRQSAADFLVEGCVRDPRATFLAGIRRLPPAHCLALSGDVRLSCYWTLQEPAPLRYRRGEDYVHQFQHVLKAAVADRLPRQPVSVLMSGGLDSTSIAAMARSVAGAGSRLEAHTVMHRRLVRDQEEHFALSAAGHLGIPVHFLCADEYRLCEAGGSACEPACDALGQISNDLLRRASQRTRVALSGDGGDVIFLYPLAGHMRRMRQERRHAAAVRDLLWYVRAFGGVPRPLMPRLSRWLGTRPAAIDLRQYLRAEPGGREVVRDAGWADSWPRADAAHALLDPFWPAVFEQENPGSTGVPVEVRYPLLDLRVVEFALAIPPVPWMVNKHILRRAMRGLLPRDVRLHPKSPAGDLVRSRLLRGDMDDTSWAQSQGIGTIMDTGRVGPPCPGQHPDLCDMALRAVLLDRWLADRERRAVLDHGALRLA